MYGQDGGKPWGHYLGGGCCALLLLALPGCYAGLVGAIVGASSSSGDGGSDAAARPEVQVLQVRPVTEIAFPGFNSTVTGCPTLPLRIAECVSDRSMLQEEIARAASLDSMASRAVLVRFQLFGAKAPVTVRLFSGGKEVATGDLLLDGSPSGARTEPLETARPYELSVDLSRFGATRTEDVVLALKPERGSEVRETVTVDNRPPIGVRLCSFQPGFSCLQRGDLGRRGRCTFTLPSEAPISAPDTRLILLYLESPDAGEPCRTLRAHVIPLDVRPVPGGEDACADSVYEAEFDLPQVFDCVSTGVVAAIAELSGASNPDFPLAAGVHVSDTLWRINSSAPTLEAFEIRPFQPGSRRHDDELFGLVVIDYTVADAGEEPFDLDLSVLVGDEELLRLGDGTLTEARGAPCEGALQKPSEGRLCLGTSREGVLHRFLWNSDFDIDGLVRSGRLDEPRVTRGVTFRVTLTDVRSGISIVEERGPEIVDNTTLHTLVGLQPGRTDLGSSSVKEGQATFETISGLAIDDRNPRDPIFYFSDSGSHTVWSARPASRPGEIIREAGTGSIRVEEAASFFDDEIAGEAILRQPMDLVVDRSGAVYILEGVGEALWKLEGGKLRLLLGEEVLQGAEQMALDEVENALYIADTRNCRIIKVPLQDDGALSAVEPTSVVAGDLRELVLEGEDGFFARLFEKRLDLLESENVTGCTFRNVFAEHQVEDVNGVLPDEPPPELKLDFPRGIAVHESPAGTVLFVSDTDNDRVLRAEAHVPDPGSTLVPVCEELAVNDPLTEADEGRGLCRPSRLTLARSESGSPVLFLTLNNYVIGSPRGTKGIVVLLDIEGGPGGLPVLGRPRPFAGVADFSLGNCVRGTPSQGSTYDPGQECVDATAAALSLPTEVGIGPGGDVFFCDSRNQQLRRIGMGRDPCTPAPPSVKAPVAEGTGLVSKFLGATVEGRSPCESALSGAAGPPSICSPGGLELSAYGEKMGEPIGLHFLDAETLLIGDRGNHRVRRLDLRTATIVTIAGRPRTEAEFAAGITFAGEGVHALDAVFNGVRSVASFPREDFCRSPERKLFIVDGANHRIRVIDADDTIRTAIGTAEEFPVLSGVVHGEDENRALESGLDPRQVILKLPKHVLVDSRGRLFVSDSGRHRILKLEDGIVTRVIGLGSGFADRALATEAPIPPTDPLDPESVGEGKPPLLAALREPNEMVFDRSEEFLFFCDGRNFQVRRVRYDVEKGTFPDTAGVERVAGNGTDDPPGTELPERAFDLPISFPYGLALAPDERSLYVTETFGRCRIYRVDLADDLRESRVCRIAGAVAAGSGGDGDDAVNAQFNNPTSLRVDGAGNLYVLDGRNHRLRKFFPVASRCSRDNR